MKKRSKLVFSDDKKSVEIEFRDGTKSEVFTSKRSAIDALKAAKYEMKLSHAEINQMFETIFTTRELPMVLGNVEGKKEGIDLFDLIGVLMGGSEMGVLSGILSLITEFESNHSINVERAKFIPCECGSKEKHGRIYFKNGHTSPFSDSSMVKETLTVLLSSDYIDQSESNEVLAQVNDYFAEAKEPATSEAAN